MDWHLLFGPDWGASPGLRYTWRHNLSGPWKRPQARL